MGRGMGTVLLLALLTGAVGCLEKEGPEGTRPELTLFVAASLTDVVQEVGDAYEALGSIELVYNFASSGALARQQLAAPRADLLLSASERWMDEMEGSGRVLDGTRMTLLSNRLAVIANRDSEFSINNPADMCDSPFVYLAMGDPEYVPAGSYAREWFKSLECRDGGLFWDRVKGRISPAPNVRAVVGQVEGRVDVLGIVYATDAIARRDDIRLLYEVPVEEGPRIQYPVAIMKGTDSPALARDFLDFLRGPEAMALFEKDGFTFLVDEKR